MMPASSRESFAGGGMRRIDSDSDILPTAIAGVTLSSETRF